MKLGRTVKSACYIDDDWKRYPDLREVDVSHTTFESTVLYWKELSLPLQRVSELREERPDVTDDFSWQPTEGSYVFEVLDSLAN